MLLKILLPFIVIGLLIGGGYAAYSQLNSPNPTSTPTPLHETFSAPTSSPSTETSTETVGDCGAAYDVGYLKGLYDKDINEASVTVITEACKSSHDEGYQKGKISASSQFNQSYDTQRKADLFAISNAVYQYAAEHNGNLPDGVTQSPLELGTGSGRLNLANALVPTYIAKIPYDPQNGSAESTKYTIHHNVNGRLVLEAQSSVNQDQKITVTR